MRLDPAALQCLVFTYKEGFLSAIAHDLKIRVGQLTVDFDEATRALDVKIDATSLRVETAMKEGRESPATLSEDDKKKIQKNLVEEVLETKRHPEIRFVSPGPVRVPGGSWTVDGTLRLHGQERPIRLSFAAVSPESPNTVQAELRLNQPDYGIKPYSALLGTLKVQATLMVRITATLPQTLLTST